MKLNNSKNTFISFSRRSNILFYEHKLCQSSVTCTDSVKDMRVFLAGMLNFHNYVKYIFSRCFKLLGLVRCVTFSFSSLECIYILYFTSTDVTVMDYSLFKLILALIPFSTLGNCWTSSSCSVSQWLLYVQFLPFKQKLSVR